MHPDLSTLDVSFDPKMTKKYFREDSHAIVQNFKEIKNYVGTYSIITSPVYEPNPWNCWSEQGQIILTQQDMKIMVV